MYTSDPRPKACVHLRLEVVGLLLKTGLPIACSRKLVKMKWSVIGFLILLQVGGVRDSQLIGIDNIRQRFRRALI